jgi:hypothetical protein
MTVVSKLLGTAATLLAFSKAMGYNPNIPQEEQGLAQEIGQAGMIAIGVITAALGVTFTGCAVYQYCRRQRAAAAAVEAAPLLEHHRRQAILQGINGDPATAPNLG